MSIQSELGKRFSESKAAPILFVGSGFSRRYAGAPNWRELLSHFADLNGQSYSYYLSKASDDLPAVGSLIAIDFHELWYKDDLFKLSRENCKVEFKNIADPLKYEIANYIANFNKAVNKIDELSSLAKVPLEAIITTNYDQLLETIFNEYQAYDSQDSMILTRNYGFGEIYKIHGCIGNSQSIVLTSDDYKAFEDRNLILAAKLLTLIVEHPIVFIGYSLSDRNIRTILTSIIKCLNHEGLSLIRDNVYIVEWSETEAEEVSSRTIRIDNMDLPYTYIRCAEFTDLYDSMATFERRFPVRMLRNLKKAVYELVESTDVAGKLISLNIDDADDLEKADFVIGVGLADKLGQQGYVGLNRDEVFNFGLNGGTYDAELLLSQVVPGLLKGTASCPIFRFLNESGRLVDNKYNLEGLHHLISDLSTCGLEKYQHNAYSKQAEYINSAYSGVSEIVEKYGIDAVFRIAYLSPEKIDHDLLHQFLIGTRDEFIEKGGGSISNWRKLACFYDRLKFGVKNY